MRYARRGFSLIEILVVIGIIMILVGILVIGFRHVHATAATRETNTELHVCRGLLTEYETRSNLAGIESADAQTRDSSQNGAAGDPFPIYQDPASSVDQSRTLVWTSGAARSKYWPCLLLPKEDTTDPSDYQSNGSTDLSTRGDATQPRFASNSVLRTRDVLYVLMQIPANRTIVQNLPPERVLEPPPSASSSPNSSNLWPMQATRTINQGAVILDGWGNPIIFVPRGGMHVLIYANDPNGAPYIIRSTGMTKLSSVTGPDPAMTGSERPFFASAGEDGDFTKGDDNVYSFQD